MTDDNLEALGEIGVLLQQMTEEELLALLSVVAEEVERRNA